MLIYTQNVLYNSMGTKFINSVLKIIDRSKKIVSSSESGVKKDDPDFVKNNTTGKIKIYEEKNK